MKNLVFLLALFFTLLFTYLGAMGFFHYEQSLRVAKSARLCADGETYHCKGKANELSYEADQSVGTP
jgi:hypothetical protein